MANNRLWDVLNKIKNIADPAAEQQLLKELINIENSVIVSFINAHGLNLTAKSQTFRENLLRSDYLLRDGSGMSIMMKVLSLPVGLNMNGTDLIPKILSQSKEIPIALLGTKEPYLTQAKARLESQGLNIIYTCDGFQSNEHYLEQLKRLPVQPKIILLGMGMPKQEALSVILKDRLAGERLIINGGAIIDFTAERFDRAPTFLRKMGCEWLYRLGKEPRRLFNRYVIGNISFLSKIPRLYFSHKK